MKRANPMPAPQRRAAIVAATRPLVLQYGADVSTKQIAEACALAEGTLFRVFPNKEAIIRATIADLLDPQSLVAAIGRIDRSLPLPEQIERAVNLLHSSGKQIVGVFAVLHPKRGAGEPTTESKQVTQLRDEKAVWVERNEAPARALTELLGAHADQLHVDLPVAVAFIRGTVLAATHPLTRVEGLSAEALTALICRALIKEQ